MNVSWMCFHAATYCSGVTFLVPHFSQWPFISSAKEITTGRFSLRTEAAYFFRYASFSPAAISASVTSKGSQETRVSAPSAQALRTPWASKPSPQAA